MSVKTKNKKVAESICSLINCTVGDHGDQICEAIQKQGSTDDHSICFMKQLCEFFIFVLDSDGRSALHTAAAVGKNKYGADPKIEDKHGFTPIHYIINQQPLRYLPPDSFPVLQGYSWGINANYNIGLASAQARDYPENIEMPLRKGTFLYSASMNKFHTLFLTTHGKVFACGHGRGGRLGFETDSSVIIPQYVRASKHPITCIATGIDHSVFLNERHEVLTCGTNKYHQLGITPPPTCISTPQVLSQWHSKHPAVKVIGVAAAAYHTVLWSSSDIYTCGLNAGQIGHTDRHNEAFVDFPRSPPFMKNLDRSKLGDIKEVVASEGATVFFTAMGNVYACYENKTHHIPLNIGKIKKIACSGGVVDTNVGVELFSNYQKDELKIAALTTKGDVFVWFSAQSSQKGFSLWYIGDIFNFCLNTRGLCLVNTNREVYFGYFEDENIIETPSTEVIVGKRRSSKNLESLRHIKRGKTIATLYRTHLVYCDPKGDNFIALQYEPRLFQKRKVELPPNSLRKDISDYYVRMSDSFCNCDVEVITNNRRFSAHSYILCCESEYFYDKIIEYMKINQNDENFGFNEAKIELNVDIVNPDVFEELLAFMYTHHILKMEDPKRFILLPLEKEEARGQKNEHVTSIVHLERKSSNEITEFVKKLRHFKENSVKCKWIKKDNLNYVLKLIKDGSCALKMKELQDLLLQLNEIDAKLPCIDYQIPAPLPEIPQAKYDRQKFPECFDVAFKCNDGELISAHKCILMARSSYFEAMLGFRWNQSREVDVMDVSLSSRILTVLLDFLYTNDSPDVSNSKDLEFLCDVLATSHQYMVEGLNLLCQKSLSQALALKNALDLLKFCLAYDLDSLKDVILEFICLNMPYYFDTRSLKDLDENVLAMIKHTYEQTVRPVVCQQSLASNVSEDIPIEEELYLMEMEEYCQVRDCFDDELDAAEENSITKDEKHSHEFYYTPLETIDSSILATNIQATCLPSLEDLDMALKKNPNIAHQSVENWLQDEKSKRALQGCTERNNESVSERKRKSHKRRVRKTSSSSQASSSNSESENTFEADTSTEMFSFEDLEDRLHPKTPHQEEEWKVVGKLRIDSTPPVSSVEADFQDLSIEKEPQIESALNNGNNNIKIVPSKTREELAQGRSPQAPEFSLSPSGESPFPTLTEALASPKASTTQMKRMPKFQSKSGKKSKKSQGNSTEPSAVISSPPCAWGNSTVAVENSPVLANIIKDESSALLSLTPKAVRTRPDKNSSTNGITSNSNHKDTKEIAATSPIQIRKENAPEDFVHWNPITNTVIESPKEDFCRPFSSIVEEEVSYTKHLQLQRNKPLSMIQLEEKAMRELMDYYGGPFNPEERVTVKRFGTSGAKPSWNIQYRHV